MAQQDITPNVGVNIELSEINITANISNLITAQIAANPVTAQIAGGTATVGGTITATRKFASAFLISGANATGTAQGFDARPYANGFLWGQVSGNSASADLLASHDSSNWMTVTSFAAGQSAATIPFSAIVSAHYPFLAGRVSWVSSDQAGATAITASVWMHVTMG